MDFIKKHILSAVLSLSIFALTASLGRADTLSDLQSQCLPCHNVIVLPSGWSLDGSATGKTGNHDLAGWSSTIAAMGDGKCGFSTVGPGGTPRSVAAQFLYQAGPTISATFTPTPPTTSPTCPVLAPPAIPSGCIFGGYTAIIGPDGCTSSYTVVCLTPTPTATLPVVSETPTPTFTSTTTPTTVVSPTPTSTGMHTWYDYDYMGGRCFAKDHSIMERKWCEQHGMKGGGNHPSLTGYDRHAHLDYPGQKP